MPDAPTDQQLSVLASNQRRLGNVEASDDHSCRRAQFEGGSRARHWLDSIDAAIVIKKGIGRKYPWRRLQE